MTDRPLITIRTSGDVTGDVTLEIYMGETPENSSSVMTFRAERLQFIDARAVPEVFWQSVARRMDEAHNAGAPLWSLLTPVEVLALSVDGVDVVPESAASLTSLGRDFTDHRVTSR